MLQMLDKSLPLALLLMQMPPGCELMLLSGSVLPIKFAASKKNGNVSAAKNRRRLIQFIILCVLIANLVPNLLLINFREKVIRTIGVLISMILVISRARARRIIPVLKFRTIGMVSSIISIV